MSRDARDVLQKLCDRYRRRGVVLAVGAGVSAGSSVPSWPELLKGLTQRLYGEEKGKAVFARLVAEGYTLPAIASMLEYCSYYRRVKPEEFTEWLREEVYKKFPYWRRGVKEQDRHEFVRLVQETNNTLRAVAAMCVRRERGRYLRNPSIHAVMNFNFDDVLGVYVQARYGSENRRILRTIERPSAGAVLGRIPVYHLHGFMVFREDKFRRLDVESPDLRVFTEQEYFDFFNQPTRMGSYAFLHLLREHSFLFVGLSLRDDNIRRLLHYSRSERLLGYRAEGRSRGYARRRSTRHFALLLRSASDEVNSLTALSLRQLGTRVIWYDKHDEVPGVLRQVYVSGGDDWGAVY